MSAALLASTPQLENTFDTAWTNIMPNRIVTNAFDRWLKEKLSGLNTHVQFIHTKYMLVDPLGDDPIVITGSANFSEASTVRNDENMLVIRGHARVAPRAPGVAIRAPTGHQPHHEDTTHEKHVRPHSWPLLE